jgi:hypothetical protein
LFVVRLFTSLDFWIAIAVAPLIVVAIAAYIVALFWLFMWSMRWFGKP